MGVVFSHLQMGPHGTLLTLKIIGGLFRPAYPSFFKQKAAVKDSGEWQDPNIFCSSRDTDG